MLTTRVFLLFEACLLANYVFCQDDDPIVQLPNGLIQGRITYSIYNRTFYAFQEVPYAEPPVGFLRFKPPVPKSNWSGVLKTQQNTKICYQMPAKISLETEDCLYLNVYTPVKPGSVDRLPVLFFIHGGGFVEGNSIYNTYGPQRFMDYDIVVVTVNYRLGLFGFLSTGDLTFPGNNGLKDQNLALQWVQNNIHLFGGDSSKVTIYGQSAGAASVSYHLLSKKSEGLFRAAILSSGSALSPWSFQRDARKYAYQAASYFSNFTYLLTPEALNLLLMALPATLIDEIANKIPEEVYNEQMVEGFFFAPVVEPEHDDAFITEKMYESFVAGNFTKVPTLIGINSEESIYRLLNADDFRTKVQAYESDIRLLATNDFNIPDDKTRAKCGEAIRRIYSDGDLADNLIKAISYFSDVSFNKPVIRTAEILAQYTDVYFYQFSFMMKIFGIYLPIGVYHGGEIPFIWDFLLSLNDPDNIMVSQRMLKLFTNFVITMNPTPIIDPDLQNIQIPKVTQNYFPYINIGFDLTIQENPKNESYPLWKKVYEDFGVRPFDTY